MKYLFMTVFAIWLLTMAGVSSELPNGAFYPSDAVECHLMTPAGIISTNILFGGTTYVVGNATAEIIVGAQTEFYFANGLMIEAESNSVFRINSYTQEILNSNSPPERVKLGTHIMDLTFSQGQYSIICPAVNTNSLVEVTTPLSSYQLTGGKYFIQVNNKSVIAYVMEGNMQFHNSDQLNLTSKEKIAIAIPFIDPVGSRNVKVVTNIKSLTPDEISKLSAPIVFADKKYLNVQFFVISHQIIGIKM